MAYDADPEAFEAHPLLGPRYQKGDCARCWHSYVADGQRLVIRHRGRNPVPGMSEEVIYRSPCPHRDCPRTYPPPRVPPSPPADVN